MPAPKRPRNMIQSNVKAFNRKLVREMRKKVPAIQQKVQAALEDQIRIALSLNPTMQALLDPQSHLRGELGLRPTGPTAPFEIFETIYEHLVKNSRSHVFLHGIRSSAQHTQIFHEWRIDVQGLVALPFARFVSHPRIPLPGVDYTVYWLEWLLTQGDAPVNFGAYSFESYRTTELQISEGEGIGRSGQNILMRRGRKWVVPAHHSGVNNNNFITRALTQHWRFSRYLRQTIKQILTEAINSGNGIVR